MAVPRRSHGKERSKDVADVTGLTLRDAMVGEIDKASYVMTGESPTCHAVDGDLEYHNPTIHKEGEAPPKGEAS
jgi:hypothetical protein